MNPDDVEKLHLESCKCPTIFTDRLVLDLPGSPWVRIPFRLLLIVCISHNTIVYSQEDLSQSQPCAFGILLISACTHQGAGTGSVYDNL